MGSTEEQEYEDNIFPKWYWILVMIILFIAMGIGVYLYNKPVSPVTSIVQNTASFGMMKTPGAL